MTHNEIRKRHAEHLRSYSRSAEFAAYARAAGFPVPEGDLPSLFGHRWEIDRETYWEFLEVLPPLGQKGGTFYLSEFIFDNITTKYTCEGGRYFCEFARWPEREQTPDMTPWGKPDTVTKIAPGLTFYSTPSHGGYWLSPERVAEMPAPLRDFEPWGAFHGPGRFYEEDCDWSVVCLAFPQYFPPDAITAALTTLQHYKAELFADVISYFEQQGRHVYTIHYADKEMAREQGDPTLGIVTASSKDEAEAIARQDAEIMRRSVPCASLWACEVRGKEEGRAR